MSLAPDLCLSTLPGFVSWTSYLHKRCCRQPHYRYVTSFVKFTYWRKYEVSKSQNYSEVKHPAAWGCHPAALLQGRRSLPSEVGRRREHFGDASDTQRGTSWEEERLGSEAERWLPGPGTVRPKVRKEVLWWVRNTALTLRSQPNPRASGIPILWH